jgi:hypothetical protein
MITIPQAKTWLSEEQIRTGYWQSWRRSWSASRVFETRLMIENIDKVHSEHGQQLMIDWKR